MTFDYSRSVQTANRLIERFGQTLALRREGDSAGPSYEPVREAPTFHKLIGVEVDGSIVDDTGVRRPVKSWLIRVAEGLKPQSGDKLMVSGAANFLLSPRDANYRADVSVGEVKAISPGGVTVLYQVYAAL